MSIYRITSQYLSLREWEKGNDSFSLSLSHTHAHSLSLSLSLSPLAPHRYTDMLFRISRIDPRASRGEAQIREWLMPRCWILWLIDSRPCLPDSVRRACGAKRRECGHLCERPSDTSDRSISFSLLRWFLVIFFLRLPGSSSM